MPKAIGKFETERTKAFRAGSLSAEDEVTISHIEKFGCSVIHVEKTETVPGWSYSVGIFDTSGKPEIITVGLSEDAAHFLVNKAARELRSGTNLTEGRHSDLLGNVECEFRPVDPKWIRQVMGWAAWYYGGIDFPVLQAVYPDLENRFPEEDGFNAVFRRPLMQPSRPMTVVEQDFWASNDPDSSLFNWKFSDPPHTGVYLSATVNSGAEAVTYVSHDIEDGAWQFLGDSMTESGGVLSCFHHPIDRDPSLTELVDLPIDWWAERDKPGEPWVRHEHEHEESSNDEQESEGDTAS